MTIKEILANYSGQTFSDSIEPANWLSEELNKLLESLVPEEAKHIENNYEDWAIGYNQCVSELKENINNSLYDKD